MEAQLPRHILDFFDKTTRTVDESYRPGWLITPFSDSLWRIDTRAGDLRNVKGKIKGGVELNWARRFPRARFTDEAYASPLKQAKLILIAGLDCCSAGPGLSPLSISMWHGFLMHFAEHLAVKYSNEFRRLGFKVGGMDDVTDFLAASGATGVAGTGLYIERWQRFLSDNCGEAAPTSEAARSFLCASKAYDRLGKIRSEYVADAIEIDQNRVRLSGHMRKYLIGWDRNRSESCSSESPNESATPNDIVSFITLSEVMRNSVYELANCELADTRGVAERCSQFKRRIHGRTRTLPPSVGSKLVLGCCRWMIETARELETFTARVCSSAMALSTSLSNHGPLRWLWEAEQNIALPAALLPVRKLSREVYRALAVGSSKYAIKYPLCLVAIRLHVAVCFSTIALLSCSRRGEVLELEKDAIFSRRDRSYLSVKLRKRGIHGIRLSMDKPVPHLVTQCVDSLARVERELVAIFGRDDPLSAKRVFFKANAGGLSPFTKDDVSLGLAAISKLFGLVGSDGSDWKLKPHQLRRHFAMTFFHSGGAEDVLPALAWFMGHENISSAWRYVREDLTGREVSEAEAALATAAVLSTDESAGVARLRSIALQHFGCNEISVMNESDLQDYLEMLAERGRFTAEPVQIHAGHRLVYTILITINEEFPHATAD